EGLAGEEQLRAAYGVAFRGIDAENASERWVLLHEATAAAGYAASPDAFDAARKAAGLTGAAVAVEVDGCIGEYGECSNQARSASTAEAIVQCDLMRDIFGNPFRPITINPAWQTPTVLALATAAYDNRTLPAGTLEPARLSVLADALEEAGCTNSDI